VTLETPTMRNRFAAQSVIEELLQQQSSLPPRSPLARFFGRSPLSADTVPWYVGAKGERVVGSILETLPPEWTVFHALPVGAQGADIDHLVVGPGGVFTINTKHHAGKNVWVGKKTMTVSGQKVQHIRNAEFEAARVTQLVRERMPLLTPVQPVVALVDPKQLTIREKPEQVKVLDARELRNWLIKLHPVLTEWELMELDSIIDSPETWREVPATEPGEVMARFTALDADVHSAGVRRVLWALLGIVATIGLGVVVIPPVAAALVLFLVAGL
jgi:hypothetical protein